MELLKNGVFLRPLDRSMEYEADKLGVVIAARSGYDPYGLVAVLEMLAQTRSDGSGLSVLDTHPAPADRLAELEGFVPRVEGGVTQPQQVEARFRKVVGAAPVRLQAAAIFLRACCASAACSVAYAWCAAASASPTLIGSPMSISTEPRAERHSITLSGRHE